MLPITPHDDCGDLPLTIDDLLRSRRTIGSFKAEAPSRAVIDEALELATWAPNHRKTEPWRFLVLGPETVGQIVALNAELIAAKKGAEAAETKRQQWASVPGWLAVTCVRDGDELQQQEDYAACCCAVQNLMLALWSRGVGTKWSTGDVTRHPRFAELLHFDPERELVVGLIWYGYPAVIPQQTRRSLSDVVRELP